MDLPSPLTELPSTQLPSAAEMAALDAATIAAGVPARQLMERAGNAVLAAVAERFPRILASQSTVIILCGPGNNGGDGLVIARALRSRGLEPIVVIAAAQRYSGQHDEQLRSLIDEGGRCVVCENRPAAYAQEPFLSAIAEISVDAIAERMSSADFIIDALLGTGQSSAPRAAVGALVEVVRRARSKGSKLISVDIPSGVDADTGAAFEPHISADLTVVIQLIKRGLVQSPAFEHCGDIVTVDIGIRVDTASEFSALTRATIPAFPSRARDAHKGTAGRVLVIGGSAAMPGAPVLSALGALRVGAGIVVATRFESAGSVARPPELIDLLLPGDGLSPECVGLLAEEMAAASAVVLGPGIGRNEGAKRFVQSLLPSLREPARRWVVDADALNLLSELGETSLGDGCIITPHPGEAARLLKTTGAAVQADRYSAARALREASNATVVLKGASTIVYEKERGYVNTTGNPWMATPGSGDILAGIGAGLLSQGLGCIEAASLGVYLHGMAGDLAHRAHNGPIIATDIAQMLPNAAGALQ